VAILIVVNNPRSWPLHIPGTPVVSAHAYLTDPRFSRQRNVKVFNLCRSYRYQSSGYYVSLLAMARGHKPLPSITTIQDMKTLSLARIVAEDLDELVQRALRPIRSRTFTLSVYFGQNVAKRYDELSSRLFRLFSAPLLRAEFAFDGKLWRLQTIGPLPASDIPASHLPFVVESATQFFRRNRLPSRRSSTTPYSLAILVNPSEALPPSNKTALRKFAAAGKRNGFAVEFIERADFGRLAEFDALFIRETTQVNHYTYRFARRALANDLVVIDDPDSIAKCTNKVYLAELLARYKVSTPRTLIVHRENRFRIGSQIGFPCIVKLPDSSFSQGVHKVDDDQALQAALDSMLDRSDLVIAQEFVPTEFDWRIGLLDREPLYACKYYMVKAHWQILKTDGGRTRDGDVETVPLTEVPAKVLQTAVRAGRLVGRGLYGVDVKHVGGKAQVIEINENPNIDAGYEDRILKNELYDRIMRVFLERVHRHRNIPNGATS